MGRSFRVVYVIPAKGLEIAWGHYVLTRVEPGSHGVSSDSVTLVKNRIIASIKEPDHAEQIRACRGHPHRGIRRSGPAVNQPVMPQAQSAEVLIDKRKELVKDMGVAVCIDAAFDDDQGVHVTGGDETIRLVEQITQLCQTIDHRIRPWAVIVSGREVDTQFLFKTQISHGWAVETDGLDAPTGSDIGWGEQKEDQGTEVPGTTQWSF